MVKLATSGDETAAESRETITISMSDSFDETMGAQPLRDADDLCAGFVWQQYSKPLVAESVNGELATQDGELHDAASLEEEVEATPGTIQGIAHRHADETTNQSETGISYPPSRPTVFDMHAEASGTTEAHRHNASAVNWSNFFAKFGFIR